jgi:hypothetical protein
MKKILMMALLFVLLALFTVPSLAATGSVDMMLGGQIKVQGGDSYDANVYIFNTEQVWKDSKFKFGGDLFRGTVEDVDYSGYDIKGGYRITNTDSLKLDLTFSLYKEALSSSYEDDSYYYYYYYESKLDVTGGLIGVDLIYNINDRSFIEGSVAISLFAGANSSYYEYDDGDEYEGSGSTDCSIVNYKIKYNYLISDNTALGIGYRVYQTDFKSGDYNDYSLSGLIAGVTFNF